MSDYMERACDGLVDLVSAWLVAQVGAGVVPVARAWPDEASKAATRACVAVIAGPTSLVAKAPQKLSTVTVGDDIKVRYGIASWTGTATIQIAAEHRDQRDALQQLVRSRLSTIPVSGGRVLTLSAYYDAKVQLRVTGTRSTDEAEASMMGEWRGDIDVELRGAVIEEQTYSTLADLRMEVNNVVTILES